MNKINEKIKKIEDSSIPLISGGKGQCCIRYSKELDKIVIDMIRESITEDIKKLSPLSLNLTNIPWDQALDTILNLNKLVAKKNGIILLVTTLASATKDKKLEIDAKKVAKKEGYQDGLNSEDDFELGYNAVLKLGKIFV